MPLKRFDDCYWEGPGDAVLFLMADGDKRVTCMITRETLADYTKMRGRPVIGMFETHCEFIERAASNLYDGGGSFDQDGRVLVTLAGLSQATRST